MIQPAGLVMGKQGNTNVEAASNTQDGYWCRTPMKRPKTELENVDCRVFNRQIDKPNFTDAKEKVTRLPSLSVTQSVPKQSILSKEIQ